MTKREVKTLKQKERRRVDKNAEVRFGVSI
jgi:hypothetical protein